MATKSRAQAIETSTSIEYQTKVFLEKGGVIEQIKSGVSGQNFSIGRKQISLGNAPKKD